MHYLLLWSVLPEFDQHMEIHSLQISTSNFEHPNNWLQMLAQTYTFIST